ncbi:MAG TPA: hypothetical protein VEU30_07905 [Thermoanaerobaculia bacterium]|nr:hypothetical protein [Thermoanaerobaculia bacterium]
MFKYALLLAGLTQIAIAVSSLLIPRLLDWPAETRRLTNLTRHVFWTYAGYTFGIHLAFGILSLSAPSALLERTTLAAAVTGFIAVYWAVRVVLQFAIYDRSIAATKPLFQAGEVLYATAFVFLALTNGAAALYNAGVIG